MTSAVAETSVLGDPGNAQGFKTAAGVLVSPAEVIWTAYTTNDTTAPSASATLSLVGRDFLTFQYLSLIGGTGNIVLSSTATSTNITFRDCQFANNSNSSNSFSVTGAAFSVVLSWLLERCVFSATRNIAHVDVRPATGVGADWDIGFIVRNCLMSIGGGVQLAPTGASANKPGGMLTYNCTFQSRDNAAFVTGANSSTSIPCQIMNSFCLGSKVEADTLGQLVENYNWISQTTTHTNVTQGANTVTNSANAYTASVGQERLYGYTPRMFMEPKVGSWMLTFGNDGTYTTAEDFLGLPRPGGGASATKGIGYLGRGNTFTKETGTVRTGSNAISITGPGTQDFQLPVDATSTTATVYVRWDATYAGTKPLMKVLNGGECGVTDATATATGASGSWEQLSLNFTPARTGIVTIRLQSSDTNGAGVMYVDDFSVV